MIHTSTDRYDTYGKCGLGGNMNTWSVCEWWKSIRISSACEVDRNMPISDSAIRLVQDAVSTAHAAQSNTIEHPMAMEWRRLQIYQEKELEALFKVRCWEPVNLKTRRVIWR